MLCLPLCYDICSRTRKTNVIYSVSVCSSRKPCTVTRRDVQIMLTNDWLLCWQTACFEDKEARVDRQTTPYRCRFPVGPINWYSSDTSVRQTQYSPSSPTNVTFFHVKQIYFQCCFTQYIFNKGKPIFLNV